MSFCQISRDEARYNSGEYDWVDDEALRLVREGDDARVDAALEDAYGDADPMEMSKALLALSRVNDGDLIGSDALAAVLKLAREVRDNVADKVAEDLLENLP
jgi:hypothetical protein